MIILIDCKTCVYAEKNSEIIGRTLIICNFDSSVKAAIIVSKNIIWIDQNSKQIEKTLLYLLTDSYCYQNILDYRSTLKSKPHSKGLHQAA